MFTYLNGMFQYALSIEHDTFHSIDKQYDPIT